MQPRSKSKDLDKFAKLPPIVSPNRLKKSKKN